MHASTCTCKKCIPKKNKRLNFMNNYNSSDDEELPKILYDAFDLTVAEEEDMKTKKTATTTTNNKKEEEEEKKQTINKNKNKNDNYSPPPIVSLREMSSILTPIHCELNKMRQRIDVLEKTTRRNIDTSSGRYDKKDDEAYWTFFDPTANISSQKMYFPLSASPKEVDMNFSSSSSSSFKEKNNQWFEEKEEESNKTLLLEVERMLIGLTSSPFSSSTM